MGVVSATTTSTTRRFAPPGGFLSGALWAQFDDGVFVGLVWRGRLPERVGRDVTLARAVRLVQRGTWEELPPPPRPGRVRRETLRSAGCL